MSLSIIKKAFIFILIVSLAFSAGLTFLDLQKQLLEMANSPFVSLMFIYDSASENGPAMRDGVKQIAKKTAGYFDIKLIDCNSDDEDLLRNFPYCGPEIKSKLPALTFIEPELNPTGTEQPKNHQYSGQLTEKALYDFAAPLMKLYSVNVRKTLEWRRLQQKYPNSPKLLYFTDKEKITPFFKTLTGHFRNTIAFGHVFKNNPLAKELGITQFPTLLLNGKEKLTLSSDLLQMVKLLKQYEGPETKINIEEIQISKLELTKQNLNETVYQKEQHSLVHLPAADGTPHPEWKRCQQSFKKMFEYYESDDLGSELGVKQRPAIIYFPKSIAKKQIKKTIFYSKDIFRNIYDEISSLIEDFTVPLSDDLEMQKFTSLALQEGRFVTVLFHSDDISLSYRVLSNDEKFKEALIFFRMKDPSPEVMSKFGVKKLPSLFVMMEDEGNQTKPEEPLEDGRKAMNLRIAAYTGKYNYDELNRYLSVFVKKAPETQVKVEDISKKLNQINSNKRFKKVCSDEGCYILLLNQAPEKNSLNEESINIFKRSTKNIRSEIAVLDGVCHGEFIQKLQIFPDELPALIYLNTKFQKYARLVGRIEEKSIQNLIKRVQTNKVIWKAYNGLELADKDCAKQHERIKELDEGAAVMSEQEAQILEEVKLQEEQRRNSESAEKESKKKKKRRRPKEEESEL